MKKEIYLNLKRFYKISIVPIVIFFILLQIFGKNIDIPKVSNAFLILLSIGFALIFPVIYRIITFYYVKSKGALSGEKFLVFEKILILIPQISIYILIVAQVFIESQIVMLILSVVAFYSLFYYLNPFQG